MCTSCLFCVWIGFSFHKKAVQTQQRPLSYCLPHFHWLPLCCNALIIGPNGGRQLQTAVDCDYSWVSVKDVIHTYTVDGEKPGSLEVVTDWKHMDDCSENTELFSTLSLFFSDLIWSFSFSYDTECPESGCEHISLCREVQICLFPLRPDASVRLIAPQIHCLICRVLELGGGCWCGDTVEKTRGDSCARSDRI